MNHSPILIPDTITSVSNAEVKFLRALHARKFRNKSGWFLAEGMRICREANTLGWDMQRLAFLGGREADEAMQPLLGRLAVSGGRALPVTEALLRRITRKDNPQTLVAAFAQRWYDLNLVQSQANRIWVALDRVRDPGNLGTVMRTADAVGAAGIILVGECTDPYSVEAVRASMGAVFNIKILACNEVEFIDFATSWSGRTIGMALSAPFDYREADFNGSLVMLMGNEQAGLTEPLKNICDQLIKIPMLGRSDSLNLAVATGVALYAILDKRY